MSKTKKQPEPLSPRPSPVEPSDPPGTGEDELRMIALDKIEPNPFNPRKSFDEASLVELGKSIEKKGVLQPIVVRPRPEPCSDFVVRKRKRPLHEVLEPDAVKDPAEWEVFYTKPLNAGDDGIASAWHSEAEAQAECAMLNKAESMRLARCSPTRYQLVAGERRWRASKLAGRKVIPAIVRNLSDHDAAEIAVIENDQREDVPPLEQAEGYARLIELGDDAETIAAKIGRPVKYVVGRLQLTHLVDELKEDLRSGKLPFGHAYLISRLKAADQESFCAKSSYNGSRLYDYGGNVIPVKRLREIIHEGFLHCLSAAPWKKDDATLTEAGACTTCPRRTGQNPTLFDELLNGEVKKGRDFCTDGKCYETKQAAFIRLQLRKAQVDAGGSPPLKITTDYYSRDKDLLTNGQYEIVPPKEAKKAKPGELQTAVVVATDEYDGDAQDLGKIVQVRVKKQTEASSGNDSYKREQKKREEKQKANRAAAIKANGLVAKKVESIVGDPDGGAAVVKIFRQLVAALAGPGGADACRMITKRRELDKVLVDDKYGRFDATREPVRQLALSMDSAKELLGLFAEIVAAHESNSWCFLYGNDRLDKEQQAFWSVFGVDRSKLVKEAETEKKLKEQGPGVLAKEKRTKEKRAIRKAGKKALAK